MKNAVKVCEKCGGKMVQMYSDDRCVEEQYICVECAYATPKTKIKGFIKAVRKQSSRDHIKKKGCNNDARWGDKIW